MPKQAISVTLEEGNLLWLRGQARGRTSVSHILDRLVSEARTAGNVHASSIRSVVGTVRIAETDPDLTSADDAVRSLFGRAGRSPAKHARVRRRRAADRGLRA
jgi:hypothetical protein